MFCGVAAYPSVDEPLFSSPMTLNTMLESSVITKVFFDVCNDSDGHHAWYGVLLAYIEDIADGDGAWPGTELPIPERPTVLHRARC